MATLSIRIDDETKTAFAKVCEEIGLSVSAAFNVFAKKVAREQKIPFKLEVDPFYSEENMAELRRRAKEMEAGINCHEHELVEA